MQGDERRASEGGQGPYGAGTATFLVVSSMVGTGVLTTSGYLIARLFTSELK